MLTAEKSQSVAHVSHQRAAKANENMLGRAWDSTNASTGASTDASTDTC